MRKVKVAILGAGSAGLSARREVARVTDDYVLIDGGSLGTTCARTGCMPSKVLIEAANSYHIRHQLTQRGIEGAEQLTVNMSQVMQHVRALRDRFVSGVLKGIESWQHTHLIRKYARFVDQHILDLGDERLYAENIIIAVGSKPVIPKPWQSYQDWLFDSDQFFELSDFPQSLAVIGLGVIGLELGQALHRLGCQVHGFTQEKNVGGLTDTALSAYAFDHFAQSMPVTVGQVEFERIENNQLLLQVNGQEQAFDKVLVAVGRAPAVQSLGLTQLSVPLQANGVPEFDNKTLQVADTRIFIAGDVTGERPLLHEASDEGRIAGYNAVRDEVQCFARRTRLAISFSDPNIALVGQSHAQLCAEGADFVTGVARFNTGRAIVMDQTAGVAHIYADRCSGRVLGAEMMAPAGEHLAHLLAWVISQSLTVDQVLSLPFYHPVLEENLRAGFRHLSEQLEQPLSGPELMRCQDVPVQ